MNDRNRVLGMKVATLALGFLALPAALGAQATLCAGANLSGTVQDTNGGVIPQAVITLDGRQTRSADAEGHYNFDCVSNGKHTLHAEAEAFAAGDREVEVKAGARILSIQIDLLVKGDPQMVEAVAEETTGIDNTTSSGSKTTSGDELTQMADDPDDFQRQLQVLASAGGGVPGNATISLDGFQEAATMPPKSSLAYIRINPDLFSSEYGEAPFEGGRIEIYTKPGAPKYHGALFATGSPTWLNARDPFANSKAALGKRRYGFELTGPLLRNKSDLSINLEKRDIDNFAVVYATTLDSNYQPTLANYNVPQFQRLWIGSIRSGWQLNKQNLATFSYNASVNNMDNVNVGGVTLQEAGVFSKRSEYVIRAVVITTLSPRLVHEGRIGFTMRYRDDQPNSTATAISVSGAFTGGGAITGELHDHENNIEINDDLLYNRGKHALKIGLFENIIFMRQRFPTLFNGQYYFGGLNPQTTGGQVVNGLTQYQSFLTSGGTATTYSVTTGHPAVYFDMVRTVLYVQDQIRLTNRVQVTAGLRYQAQTDPSVWSTVMPRFGVAWSPDKKQKLVLRARVGLFASRIFTSTTQEIMRLNGTRQIASTYYNPTQSNLIAGGNSAIITQRTFADGINLPLSLQSHFAVEYAFPKGFSVQANLFPTESWGTMRSRNINAPLNDQPTGPRPLEPNVNLYQLQRTGHLRGRVLFFGLDQHSFKRVQISLGYTNMNFRSSSDGPLTSPQSATSDAGELARPSYQNSHHVFLMGTVNLPWKIAFSPNFSAASGLPFNITTGVDNNGDGNFNDRPFYAAAGSLGAIRTRYGILSNAPDAGATIERNLGTLPWAINFDGNLSRTFILNSAAQRNSAKTLSVNLRAANLINHTNVVAVGGVLGSTLFDTAYAADFGRRVEGGIRFSF